MIYITGDTHIPIDIHKLSTLQWPDQMNMTKDDYLIVCGDFGLLLNYRETGESIESCPGDRCWNSEELYWYNWLNERRFTTLFIDGNHENFDRLDKYPVTRWNGGKVQMISDSIIRLMRGQVYTIGSRTLFTMGGARSHDRGPATGTEKEDNHKIWWEEELPSEEEYAEAIRNLEACDREVDYILSHEAPAGILQSKFFETYDLPEFLQDVGARTRFKRWYCGHHHVDEDHGKVRLLYDDIVLAGE